MGSTEVRSHLLLRSKEGEPLLEDAPLDGACVPRQVAKKYKLDTGAAPDDLERQRWGLIAPEGPRGDALLDAVGPLVARRREEQGGRPVVVHRVPAGQSADEASDWRDTVFRPDTGFDDDVPGFVVILGDLDEVALDLQRSLAALVSVGRLPFRAPDDHRRYAEKVLRLEPRSPASSVTPLHFCGIRDGTLATELGRIALIGPALSEAKGAVDAGRLPARILEAEGAVGRSTDAFREYLADASGVLLSVSHGQGPGRSGWASVDDQRRLQGSMCLAAREVLTAEHVRTGPCLRGGLWVSVSCFGAGTPTESVFFPWVVALRDGGAWNGPAESVLKALPAAGERPFVSALASAALANDDGPLAFIGHVDLAWSYSFQPLHRQPLSRPGLFLSMLRQAAERRRVGVALRELVSRRAAVDERISYLDRLAARQLTVEPLELAHLRMLREDLATYVLLGDPAARLA